MEMGYSSLKSGGKPCGGATSNYKGHKAVYLMLMQSCIFQHVFVPWASLVPSGKPIDYTLLIVRDDPGGHFSQTAARRSHGTHRSHHIQAPSRQGDRGGS